VKSFKKIAENMIVAIKFFNTGETGQNHQDGIRDESIREQKYIIYYGPSVTQQFLGDTNK
jgi:hypothetical protein